MKRGSGETTWLKRLPERRHVDKVDDEACGHVPGQRWYDDLKSATACTSVSRIVVHLRIVLGNRVV